MRLRQIGVIRSTLTFLENAPLQGAEGAPDAWIEVEPAFVDALEGVAVGQEVVVLTWLHLADREVLRVHPRGDTDNPLTGVFASRSQDRPNPIGLHRVRVLEVERARVRVKLIEAVDGTPVVDIKIALATC